MGVFFVLKRMEKNPKNQQSDPGNGGVNEPLFRKGCFRVLFREGLLGETLENE